jgi:hypothetical protein
MKFWHTIQCNNFSETENTSWWLYTAETCCEEEGWVTISCTGDRYIPYEIKETIPPVKKKNRSQPLVGNIMLTLFQDSQEPILKNYQEKSVTINSDHYSEMLHDKLKPVVRSKFRRHLCCITIPAPMLLPTMLKHSRRYTLKPQNIRHAILTLLHQIFTCSNPSEMF